MAGGTGDDGLLASMAARLAQVEALNHQMAEKLAARTEELEAMRQCLAGVGGVAADTDLAKLVGDSGPVRSPALHTPKVCKASGQEVAVLRAENVSLRSQVEDMALFMAEYGLTWVPRRRQQEQSETEEPAEAQVARGSACGTAKVGATSSSADAPRGRRYASEVSGVGSGSEGRGEITVDIKVIRARVEGLNAMLEDDGPQVVKDEAGGVRRGFLATNAAAVPLTFFADGVKLADWSFMLYTSPTTQKVIKDILDGFFPKLLQEEHPNGIALRVVDRTGNAFKEWLREFAREDPELADGGDRLRPACGGSVVKAPADQRSAGERLLAKLPERVVRSNGQISDVRSAIAERLGTAAGPLTVGARSRCASAPVSETGAGAAAGGAAGSGRAAASGNAEVSLLEAGRDAATPIARLQVKLETGHRMTLLMEPHATIGALWQALSCWRKKNCIACPEADGRQCCLRSAFPPRTYTDKQQTLQAAGLLPSATLFVT